MMNRIEMEKALKQFLVSELLVEVPVDEIRTDMGLASELSVDSLGFTELMAHLEDMYDIKISDEEFVPDNFRCLDTVIALVEQKLAA
ncbi:coronafacic acid synthetase, acyl carrier protein component [Paenibacillus curdlanolyticus YK9]|uniref:Coronafacic acid synthetase, acyl carrier protein component n=2 Tax=Paenibacillus curdlanolyticus TaxID=59840 RepID=E0I8M9_9BACL|nr:coronafacic acid synthetase, acyl carrier protein component [Paenibacillus curdlanolyticus YK9]